MSYVMTGRLIKDINTNGSSSPTELIDVEGILYFAADSSGKADGGASETGLWKSDGSDGGTRLIRSFDGISNLTEANGKLYFITQDSDKYEI